MHVCQSSVILLAGACAALVPGCVVAPARSALPAQAAASPAGAGDGAADPEAVERAGLEALQLLTAGAEALAAGHAEEALLLLESAPAGTAAEGDRRFLCGVALLELDQLEAARAHLEAAVALQPQDVSTRCVLARVHRGLRDLPAAAAVLRAAVALDEGDAHLHTLLGHLLLEQQEWGQAYDEFLQAVRLDASEVDAHRGLAQLFAASRDPENAAVAWRQALALAPDDAALHAGLGSALRAQGRHAEALLSCARAAELLPGSAVHRANLASVLAQVGRLAEAREAFAQALGMDLPAGPQRGLVHLHFGELLERLGDPDGAADEYLAALADDPDLAFAHEALGLMLLDGGDPAGALVELRRALAGGGISAQGLLQLALLHEGEGDHESARRCARILAEDGSGNPEVAFRHAQLLVASEDAEIADSAAAIDILQSLLRGTGDATGAVWNLLGEALAREGSWEGAVAAASRALELAGPDHPAAARYRWLRAQYLTNSAGR